MERDAFQPNESINFRLSIDNTKCSQSINGFKCKLFREMRAWTQTKIEFVDKVELIKIKFTDVVPAQGSLKRDIQFNLSQINLHNIYIEMFKAKKPHIVEELKHWLLMIQQSLKTDNLECKYYIECEFKGSSIVSNSLPTITVPVQIYYHNNMFTDLQVIPQPFP